MASTNKTENFNLPQWQSGDKPVMQDFNDAFKNLSDAKGAAGGIMGLPATLPAVGAMLKMGTGGVPAEAADGVDYGMRITRLWTGWQTAVGTITLSQPISSFKKVVIATAINNFPQGVLNNDFYPAEISNGISLEANVNVWGTFGYIGFTFNPSSISVNDVSKAGGAGIYRVLGIK